MNYQKHFNGASGYDLFRASRHFERSLVRDACHKQVELLVCFLPRRRARLTENGKIKRVCLRDCSEVQNKILFVKTRTHYCCCCSPHIICIGDQSIPTLVEFSSPYKRNAGPSQRNVCTIREACVCLQLNPVPQVALKSNSFAHMDTTRKYVEKMQNSSEEQSALKESACIARLYLGRLPIQFHRRRCVALCSPSIRSCSMPALQQLSNMDSPCRQPLRKHLHRAKKSLAVCVRAPTDESHHLMSLLVVVFESCQTLAEPTTSR